MVFNRKNDNEELDSEIENLMPEEKLEESFADELVDKKEETELKAPSVEDRLTNLESVVLRMLNNG